MENKIEEANVTEVNEIVKPTFNEEIKAEIKGISTIENNINKAKEYAINLKEYYSKITFSEEEKKDAETEKAEINKQKKIVADFRKKIVADFNKPIEDFERTAKETEKILSETYDFINEQVKVFDQAELEKVREKVESYFNEYAISKDIDFIKFEDMKMSITKGCITASGNLSKKTMDQINLFVDSVRRDLDLIEQTDYKDEVLIEFKKTLQCGSSIVIVQDRHKQLEQLKQETNEEPKEEPIENKVLQAPVVEEKRYSMTFTVYGTKNQLSELTKYLEKEGLLNE